MEEESDGGSEEFYSDKALLLRESLKFDQDILHTLDQLWQAVDSDQNGRVTEDEYKVMMKKLYFVLTDQAHVPDDQKDHEAAQNCADEDWQKDSFGMPFMDRSLFVQAYFQLTDLWTHEINAVEYNAFLKKLLHCTQGVSCAAHLARRRGRRV